MMSFLLLWISTLFFGAQCQYPGAPPAEPVDYPMIPTDSDFENFQCFSEDEIVSLREEFGITDQKLEIFQMMSFKSDDWSLDSLAFSILWRELLSISVELYRYYDGAGTLIGEQNESVAFHAGMLKKDAGMLRDVDAISAGTSSQTSWLIHDDVVAELETELSSDMNLYLDLWRSYAHPAVIGAMNASNEIVIQPDDDGLFACTEQHGCLHGDSTWYPPQCNFTMNVRCMVLLQFLPEHDMEMNRALIVDEELPIVIKYMGDEKTVIGQSNFQRFHEDRSRVIFQLRSTETQSISALGWTTIALPGDKAIVDAQPIVYLSPRWFSTYSIALYVLGHYSKLSQFQTEQVQGAIFAANEPVETVDLRIEKVCDWLKTKDPRRDMYPWALWYTIGMNPGMSDVECNRFDDSRLSKLVECSDSDILSAPISGDDDCLNILGDVGDAFRVLMVKTHCISDFEEERDVALQIIGFILWGLAVAVLVVVIAGTMYWRKEKIIVASSVKMLGLIYLGAVIALLYQMFLGTDILSHCYLRKFLFQIGLVMMFAALEEKTRRLATIQQNMKLLKSVKITDFSLVLRIGAMLLFVISYLTVLVVVCPIEVTERIVDRQRLSVCEWDKNAETAYVALIAAEVVALLMIGRLSWSLRTTNELSIHPNLFTFHRFYLFCSVIAIASKKSVQ